MPTLSSEPIELTIDSLSFHGGRGVGRFEGVVVFVANTAPQDRVLARVTLQKKRYWEAEVVEILTPSPARRPAPCPVADRCGGCSWQHVRYETQLEQKQKILSDSLRALKKFGEWETLPFLAAPDEYYYRSRIQLQVQDGKFGFFAKRSHHLVEIKKCWIAEGAINAQLSNLNLAPSAPQKLFLSSTQGSPQDGFTQVNLAQNKRLQKRVVEMAVGRPDWVYDLYCGSGNLTLPLFERFSAAKPFLGVEMTSSAIDHARRLNPQIDWRAGDVARVLRNLKPPAESGRGLIVLDPPRQGISPDVGSQILALAPKQILYVSCNPTTLARDVEPWLAGGNYRLSQVQGLDMFPQTEHVEMIASLCAAT